VVLLCLDRARNRELLAQWLREQGYETVSSHALPSSGGGFDLCILDAGAMNRLSAQIREYKRAQQPWFVPFVLLMSQADRQGAAGQQALRAADEILPTPVAKLELQARLETLMRVRRLSRFSQQQYVGLAENAPLGVFLLREGHVTYANKLFRAMAGLERRQAAGTVLLDIIHPDDRQLFWSSLAEGPPQAEAPFRTQFRLTPQSGGRWVELRLAPLADESGEAFLGLLQDIHQRKRALEELEASERRYSVMLESMLEGCAVLDSDLNYVYVNSAAAEMVGLSPQEMAGRGVEEVLPGFGRDNPEFLALLRSVLDERAGHRVDMEFRHPGGGRSWFELDLRPVPEGVFLLAVDISDRVQALRALTESEKRYRSLFETMTQGVIYQDAGGGIIDANPAAQSILGRSLEEMTGRSSVVPLRSAGPGRDEELPGDRHPAMAALATGEPVLGVEVGVFNPREEEHRWIRINAIPQFRPGEDRPHQVHTTFEDITARRKAETALKQSERKYRLLYASIRDAILVADTDRTIIDCNPACAEMFGYPPEEIVGKKTSWLYESEEEFARVGEMIRAHQASDPFLAVIRYQRRDGRAFPGETSVNYLRDEAGEVVGFIGLIRDISDRLAAETSLRESRARFQTLFHHAADAIFIVSEDSGRILEANQPAAERLGWRQEELIGMSCRKIIDSAHAPAFREHLRQVVEGGGGTFESVQVAKDGRRIPVEIKARLIELDGGRAIMGVARDISERRAAEAALAKVERARRAISACNRTLVRAADETELVSEVCRTMVEVAGYRFAWAGFARLDLPQGLAPAGHWGDCPGLVEKVMELWGQGEAAECPCRQAFTEGSLQVVPRLHRQGSYRPWSRLMEARGLGSAVSIPLKQGERVLGILSIYAEEEDSFEAEETEILLEMADDLAFGISALRAKEERDRAALQLSRSEANHRRLVEAMPDGLVVVDPELAVTFVNQKACEMSGHAQAELLDRSVTEFLSPASRDQALRNLEQLAHGELAPFEAELVRADGSVLPVLVSARPVHDEAGAFAGAYSVVTDLSDLKRLHEQLARAQKLESIGQLAAGIAHEINTPTQYIYANVEFLNEAFQGLAASLSRPAGGGNEESGGAEVDYLLQEVPEALEGCLEGVRRVTAIVDSMRYFSHPGSARKAPTDLNQVLENAVTISKNEWKYWAEVATELDPELPPVMALEGELSQALLNIIVNAAHAVQEKYQDDTQAQGRIQVSTRRQGQWAAITVRDNGPGVPEETRRRIFDPFFTTKEAGKGTGQGLAVARSVVEDKHQGHIGLETAEGEGAAFTIWLPLPGESG
jgi:PAS domain S-box-containing protein